MNGPRGPIDVDGQCNARLFIADDWGDNHATMRCQLDPGHDGKHREQYERNGAPVVVTWAHDERVACEYHGLQPVDWCQACHEEQVSLDDTFHALHRLAERVAAGEITEGDAQPLVAGLCTGQPPHLVRELGSYFVQALSEARIDLRKDRKGKE